MEKNNKKIPLVIYTKKLSYEGEKILNEVIKYLREKSIPFILYENDSFKFYSNNSVYSITRYDDIFFLTNFVLVIESDYSKRVVEIVDNMLFFGKDILCFPGSVYNKNAFFSNNLIRDGAHCITSMYMIREYLSS